MIVLGRENAEVGPHPVFHSLPPALEFNASNPFPWDLEEVEVDTAGTPEVPLGLFLVL